jgi:hypothetical protein
MGLSSGECFKISRTPRRGCLRLDKMGRKMSTRQQSRVWTTFTDVVQNIFPHKSSQHVRVDQGKAPEPFAVSLRTAELALQHAVDTGKEIPRELITPIIDAKYAYIHSSLDANLEASSGKPLPRFEP